MMVSHLHDIFILLLIICFFIISILHFFYDDFKYGFIFYIHTFYMYDEEVYDNIIMMFYANY